MSGDCWRLYTILHVFIGSGWSGGLFVQLSFVIDARLIYLRRILLVHLSYRHFHAAQLRAHVDGDSAVGFPLCATTGICFTVAGIEESATSM